MSISFVDITLKNNRLSIILTVSLILAGVLGYLGLPKAEDPGFTMRIATVNVRLAGASAQRMEELVTAPLEIAIMEMPELDNVQSISREGLSYITANYKDTYTDMRPIFDSLRRKVESVKPSLPAGAIGPIVDDEFGDVFGSLFTLIGEGFDLKELSDMAEDFRDELISLNLVSKVEIYGEQEEVIYVQYSDTNLREIGVSPATISNAISNANVISPGGDIMVGEERISLEPSGNYDTVADLRKTIVRDGAGNLIQLQDIARITREFKTPTDSLVFANGKPALVIAISMNTGGDILELGKQLRSLAKQTQDALPLGVELQESAFQADIVGKKINSFLVSIAQAIAIVFAVLVVFLGLRVAFSVAMLIPMAIFGTFALMTFFGVSIDQISLSGLIISLGLLVDNGIVINESLMVKMQHGKRGLDAARETINELKMPLLIASLTTVAAFSPIALAESAVGEFCAAIFYIVAMALGTSWLASLTVIPAMSVSILKNHTPKPHSRSILLRIYSAIVHFAIRFRWIVIVAILGLFFTVPFAISHVPAVFIPDSDEAIVSVELDLPLGRDIGIAAQLSNDLEAEYQRLKKDKGLVVAWSNFVGTSAPMFKLGYASGAGNASHVSSILNVRDSEALDPTIDLLHDYMASQQPDVQYQIGRLSMGPPVSYPIQVRISGSSIDTLEQQRDQIKQLLRDSEGVLEVVDDWGLRIRKIDVVVNQDRALAAGVSSQDIANSLRESLSGSQVGDFREGEDRIPITLITSGKDREDLRRLNDLTITSQSGASVSLAQVAATKMQWVTPNIQRRDRKRTVTISATLLPGYTATQVNNEFMPLLDELKKAFPFGTSLEFGGETESSDSANQSIVAKLPFAGMVILLLLVAQFNSIRRAALVIATIPIGAIGMAWGLWIADTTIGFFTILGMIALAGIIINNAIVLIESIDKNIADGVQPWEAVVAACESRMRPILLTTLTTCGGMIPLWMAGGMFETMAVTIFFGLLFGSVITLVLVPALYAILFRVKKPSTLVEQTVTG